jgi:glyoxylate reductase
MPKIFITRAIPQVGIEMLKVKGYDVTVYSKDEIISHKDLLKHVKGMDALLCLLTDKIDGEIIDAAGPQLKIISNLAVGFDNIDVEETKKRNVIVANTPGVLTETVAEHTIALLFACARRIPEADSFTKSGKYEGWGPMMFLGSDIQGKTLGIVGLGRIGGSVADHMKKGFGMKTVYYDINRNVDVEEKLGLEYLTLDVLLKVSDFVSIHVPLLPQTRHLINRERLAIMKKTAYLINTSRGAVIDEEELVAALKNKVIRGAALDVFEFEPDLAPGLARQENVVLTPHIASATEETRGKMAQMAAQAIIDVLEGREPQNRVV